MSAFVLSALLLFGVFSPVTPQLPTFPGDVFIIGGVSYDAFPFSPTYYVFDSSAGSPSPLDITCSIFVDNDPGMSWGTDNPLILSGITTFEPTIVFVNNQTISITADFDGDLSLTFSPTFIPELNGTYTCENDYNLIITTENPFLRITGEGPTFLQPSLEVLQLTVNGLFTIVNGTTVMATDTSAYQLSFQDESDNEVVMTPTDVSPSGAGPNELRLTFDAMRPFSELIGLSGGPAGLSLSNGISTAVAGLDILIVDLPILPDTIVLEEGSTLLIDCTPIGQTAVVSIERNGDGPPSSAMVDNFTLTITSVGMNDAGSYSCAVFGISREVEVVVIPGLSGGLAIYDEENNFFLPDTYVVNEFEVISEAFVEFVCFGTEGNGQLVWFAENEEASVVLDAFRGQSGAFSGTVRGVNVTVIYSGNRATLFVANVSAYSDTFKCYSDESGLSRTVTATTVNPFLGVHPSTPQSVVIDQRLEVIFIHAPALNMETIQETATFLLNNMTLSNFFLSLFNSNNQQLIRHITFPNEFDEVGNFTLSIGGVSASITVTLDVPTLSVSPGVTVVEGELLQLSCIPSISEVRVEWEFFPQGGDPRFPITGEVRDPRFDFTPPDTQHNLRLNMTTQFFEGAFMCSAPSPLVPPGNINVTVLTRCVESYSAGVVWGPNLENEIARMPCSEADPRLSGLMSRVCRESGIWRDVDFSGCTLTPPTDPTFQCPEPFLESPLLVWMLFDTSDRQRVVDSTPQLLSELSGNVTFETQTPVQFTELRVYPNVITILIDGEGQPAVAALFSAALNETTTDSINIGSIRGYVIEAEGFGDFGLVRGAGLPEVVVFQLGDICMCGQNFAAPQQLCIGGFGPPCECAQQSCQCGPNYVGDGFYCSLDSDGDGYPAAGIPCEDVIPGPFCRVDTCPLVANAQSDTSACMGLGCLAETDSSFGIRWPFTAAGMTACERCGGDSTGYATRMCDVNGNWQTPDATDCGNPAFSVLAETVESRLTDEESAFAVVDELMVLTAQETSLFPQDINNTISTLTSVINFLDMTLDQTGMANATETEPFVDVLNNVLVETNLPGFEQLGSGAQTLLDTAEVIGNYIARAVVSDDTVAEIRISRPNIALEARTVNSTQLQDIVFPLTNDLVNFTALDIMGDSPAVIIIPAELLQERLVGANSSEIPISNIIFQNLEDFLPLLYTNGSRPRSLVISSQVVVQNGLDLFSAALQLNPVRLNFSTTLNPSDSGTRCAFWNFSNPVGSGGWSLGGVTTDSVTTDGNNTFVQCTSTHLTSFAVLVDVAGARIDNLALQIVSYIGLAISLACLLLTIVFFLSFGKKLFSAVHNFVHLNLAIALFLGYLTFAVGIELAAEDKGSCQAVTALLHYFFLASFCWMLCEGIMLYLMLVMVFSKLSKKWWFFFLLGWCLPLPFLIVGLAAFLDEYGVKNMDGTLRYCWLSSGKGTNAIWTFVAPMLAIIVVNTFFLIRVLFSLYKNKGARKVEMQQEGKNMELVITIIKASLILLPLLGLTWVFGLFAVNENTIAFAWLFTIFNSLQGLFIFIAHVLRSEKVWGRIKDKSQKYSLAHSKSEGTASTAASRARSKAYSSGSGIPLSEVKIKHDSSVAPGPTVHYTDDTFKPPLDKGDEKTPTAYARLDDTAETTKEDLATTSETEPPPIESEKTPEPMQMSVTAEGSTVPVPDEEREYTLSLMKQPSADDHGQGGQPSVTEPPSSFDPVTIALDVHLASDSQPPGVGGAPPSVSLTMEDEQGMPRQFQGGLGPGASLDRSNITVRRKAFGTELLHKRNERLRTRIEALGVSLEEKGSRSDVVSDDVMLCKVVNKLHPGLITTIYDPDEDDVLFAEKHIQNVAKFIDACKKLNVPQDKMCSAGDIIDGRNQQLLIACLEHLLQSSP